VRGISGPWLLYDDQEDPFQLRNLVGEPAFAAIRGELDDRLHAELHRIGDRFAPRAHYLERWGYKVDADGAIPYGPDARVQSPVRRWTS
jgi:hypothetical protein